MEFKRVAPGWYTAPGGVDIQLGKGDWYIYVDGAQYMTAATLAEAMDLAGSIRSDAGSDV